MTMTPEGMASAIEAELKSKSSALGVTDTATFDQFAEEFADALGQSIVTYLQANAVPIVDGSPGVLT